VLEWVHPSTWQGAPAELNSQYVTPCISIDLRLTLPFTIHNTNTMSIRIASTFRLARSAVAPRAALLSISRVRTLSTSSVWRASEAAPQDPMADPKFQSFFDKIKNHQGAVDAMLKVGEVMKNKGTFGVSDSLPNTEGRGMTETCKTDL